MPDLRIPIEFKPPFRLRHHGAPGSVHRAFWLDGRPIVFRFSQEGDDGPLTVAAYSNSPLDDMVDRLKAAARHAVSADDDLAEFRKAVAGDAPLATLAATLSGLKPLRVPDLWTALLWALIDQQLNPELGKAIRKRFAEHFGPAIDVEGTAVHPLPDPDTVLRVPHRELCETGLSERKAEYAKAIAKAVASGQVDLDKIARMPTGNALQHLVDLRGVGMWAAEIAAVFGLGARDVLPSDDLGIRKAVGQLYQLPQVPEDAEVRRIGDRWAGWRSYAAVYLWWSRLPAPAAARGS